MRAGRIKAAGMHGEKDPQDRTESVWGDAHQPFSWATVITSWVFSLLHPHFPNLQLLECSLEMLINKKGYGKATYLCNSWVFFTVYII